jgi:hypothetical protein
VVDGLLAAAETAEMIAGKHKQDADRKIAIGDGPGASISRAIERELLGLAQALRSRAAGAVTGEYVPIGNPGPGWKRRRRATPITTGEITERIGVPRRRARQRQSALMRWWGKWFS